MQYARAKATSDMTSELIPMARRQHEGAVTQLIERCAGRIVSAIEIAGVGRYQADFEDAQNAALLEIWRSFPKFRNDAAVCFWMHGIARRVTASRIIDPAIRERRRVDAVRAERSPTASGPSDSIADRDFLGRILQELTPDHREILVLRYLEGFSEAETARLLGIAEKTVSSRTTRAKRAALVLAEKWS